MSDYTITIRSEGADTETVICVDIDDSTPRVVELVMRAGSGISAPTLPSFDLNLLLRALFPAGGTPVTPASVVESPTEVPAAEQSFTPATGNRSVRSGANRSGSGTTRRRTEAAVPKGRVYRRMPEDVVEVFNRTGTVTAVAEHYGVPRHTAQGWIGRLRRRGGFSAAS
ncbi:MULTISPECIES: hypothetical protein [unclassified Micromonospora]|uniref:hypothetical protein n=1 Tax=unclassified Micromonospora TaxID=2617518 RepID=UPI0010338D4C|nr:MULTISPECIES: hypothetical protein [unclassified Micromonospora]QKW14659.1 hypothetical protein HUT12_19005 [Verrucosispora sp. NA02020]TBL34159.1 hypothetical protein EYA84_16190 [Verrucosispora sp. SN26_14.1]